MKRRKKRMTTILTERALDMLVILKSGLLSVPTNLRTIMLEVRVADVNEPSQPNVAPLVVPSTKKTSETLS
jgi:hypothetical protein